MAPESGDTLINLRIRSTTDLLTVRYRPREGLMLSERCVVVCTTRVPEPKRQLNVCNFAQRFIIMSGVLIFFIQHFVRAIWRPIERFCIDIYLRRP